MADLLKLLSGAAAGFTILSLFSKSSSAEPSPTLVLVGTTPPSDQPQAPDGFVRYSGALDPAIVDRARAALSSPFGAWLPFEHPQKGSMGVLLEWHYHDPGGSLHPYGWHKGASVFIHA